MDFSNRRLANQLGFSGLVPFVFLTLACWLVHPDWLGYVIKAQLYYGLAIMSFLGGLHWGVAIIAKDRDPKEVRQALLWGVIPTLIAWCSMADVGIGFLVQMAGFIAIYKMDKRLYLGYELPDWFAVLRLRLTTVVVASMALTFIAANVRQ
jgi:hypothetical protein